MKTGRQAQTLDGEWGWLIVIGAGIVNMMFGMNYRIFGLVYLELREKFQGSATASVWVGGLNLLLGGFCGPVTAWLLERYTHRTICLVGTTMAVIGMTSTAFVPSLPLTFITYGVLLGIGISLASTSSVAMIGTYFDKRKGLALALQHSTSGLSALIFAPVMGHLIEEYSYSGTFLIFGGVFTNMYITCALFRPNTNTNHKQSKDGRSLTNGTTVTVRSQDWTKEDYYDKVDPEIIPKDFNKEHKTGITEVVQTKNVDGSNLEARDVDGYVTKYYTTEKIQNGPQHLKGRTMVSLTHTTSKDIKDMDDIEPAKNLDGRCGECRSTFSKLQNPIYATYFLVILAVTANRSVTASFLPALALEMGATHQEASFLPAVEGITAVVSSIVMGALFDLPVIKSKRVYIYSGCAFITGLAVLCMPLTGSFYILIIPTAINGGCSTIAYGQQMTVLADILGKEHAVAGLGVTRVALALGSIIGRSLSAIFVDILVTNTLGFYTMSCLPMIATVIFTTVVKCSKPAETAKVSIEN